MSEPIILSSRIPQTDDSASVLLAKLLAVQGQRLTGVGLVSLSRTQSTQTIDIDCSGFSKLVAYLDVTASPGAGTLAFRILGKNPALASQYGVLFVGTASALGVGVYAGSFGPGCSGASLGVGGFLGGGGIALPDIVRLQVVHSTTDPYTYSLGYCLVP